MSEFDPFTSTWDEACAQPGDSLAIVKWGAAQQLLAGRTHFAASPLAGVFLCAKHGLVMPDWLSAAYCERYELVARAQVASWDEAFGKHWPDGTQLARERHHMRIRGPIFRAVTEAMLANPDVALDDELFERVGRPYGAAKTLAKQLYAEAVRHYGYGGAPTKAAIKRARKAPAGSSEKLAAIKRRP